MNETPELWNSACETLRKTLGEDMFARWIASIRCTGSAETGITLAVADSFCEMYLKTNYLPHIRAAVDGVRPGVAVSFAVDSSIAPETPGDALSAAPRPARGAHAARGELRGMPLDPNFTFEWFVVGPSNGFAHAAARQAAENPGNVYNPLMICGDTGLGKTHLMQAVAHAVHARDPDATIVYVTLESMLNDFIESIRTNKAAEFRSRYRRTDLLLVDDIQFLSKSPALQEEFFNTFNALQNEHKQIILTSDQQPQSIPGLSERLVSRFQQGLVTDLQSPDYATRMAILRSKQRGAVQPLPDEFLAYVAEHITSNVRRLEGALTKLICYRNLLGRPLTLEIVTEQLSGFVADEQKAEPSCQEIQRVVAEEFEIRLADMTSKERPQNVALPRQIAMLLCRRFTRKSLPEIARAFEKTHATIVHACNTIPGRMETDRDIRRHVERIVAKLGRSFDEIT